MNKYVAVAHSFCDACANGRTCKGTCKRLQTMIKLAEKYEKVSSAYDRVCGKLSSGNNYNFTGMTKDEIKEYLLKGEDSGN